jgi:hypothetical protein
LVARKDHLKMTQTLENKALWVREFGPDYDVPAAILAVGATDTSWHNEKGGN